MQSLSRRGHLRRLIHACLSVSVLLPVAAHAQQEPEVEEVLVTGSYIRNSAFAQNSPVDTVTQADLFESGAASMGNYIRDLTYTQNTNVMNVVLGTADGAQNGNASFNLRGLGENSTLTLVDGARILSPVLSAAIPEIAINRMEVVLDGGSALYGSDAVAGVVNLIPIKEFEGFRARSYYQRTEDGAMEEMNASTLWGKNFDNGIAYVGSFEAKNKTPLMMYERTREWHHSNNASTSGAVGAFRELRGAPPGINLMQPHGGTSVGPVLRDPSCGTFNDGFPSHGQGFNSNPSGSPLGTNCVYEYSIQHAYSRHEQIYNLYNTVSYAPTDWLRLNATLNNHYRFNNNRTTGSSPNGGNDRQVMKIPANHPANPWGRDLTPWNWRVFGNTGANLPSDYDPDSSKRVRSDFQLNRIKFSAEYDMTDTWTGYTYFTRQESRNSNDEFVISSSRLQLAMSGMGGPNGDQWFNPFGSQSPLSPFYVEGVTGNSQELVDWLMLSAPNVVTNRDELDVFETLITGEVMQLPAGPLQLAAGYQWRDLVNRQFIDPFDAVGEDYANSQILGSRRPNEVFPSEVRAAFMEFEVPILDTLAAQLAVRHEQFKDFGLETTTPKISVRWEALPTLAIRASWGESFLAPSPFQARPFVEDDTCADMFSGIDEFTNTLLIGGIWCQSGNPNLKPETSTIQNLGFTWEPEGALSGFNLSMDYQEIEYTDRIRTLSQQDTVGNEFTRFLLETGIARSSYDPTPGSATRRQADTWLAARAATPGYPIRRAPDGSVARLFVQSANISSVWVDLVDVKAEYRYQTDNWGTFNAAVQATHYLTYDYQDLTGGRREALGWQNGRTTIVPPLPQTKTNLRLNWFKDKHSASIISNHFTRLRFDDQVVDLYPEDGSPTLPAPEYIDGQWYTNATYAYQFDDVFNSQLILSTGINNLFNEKPQRLGIIGGFETRLVTNFYRQFWVSLDWTPNF